MADRSDEAREKRPGDVLGTGETIVGGDTTGSSHSGDHASDADRAKRRRRMREGADSVTTGTNDLERGTGATSVDMGAGGEGTDIE